MSSRSIATTGRKAPAAGEVAYFVHLHLDTACRHADHPHKSDQGIYQVDGKPRPMLVLHEYSSVKRKRRWFLVLPITSKGRDAKDRPRTDVEPIGDCINENRESFVEMSPEQLPENMLYVRSGHHPVVAPCNPLAFANAVKVLERKVLQRRVGAVFGCNT